MPVNHRDVLSVLAEQISSFEQAFDPLHRKQTGSYYTSLELSTVMMEELINTLPKKKKSSLFKLRFLEPCVGTGSFVFAYLEVAARIGFTKEQYEELLSNIYVCDINRAALDQYQSSLTFLAENLFGVTLNDEYFEKHIGGGLLFDVDNDMPRYISIDEVFGKGSEQSFDIVATNPPYKNLKAEHSHYEDNAKHELDKIRYSLIGSGAASYLKYSVVGVLNLYKLFVEEIIERYTKKDASISLLIPSSLLTDKTCERLRTRLIGTYAIKSIKIIGEESHFVDAQQALCALLAIKGGKTGKIKISTNYGGKTEETITVQSNDVITPGNGNSILVMNGEDYAIYRKLGAFPKIKDLPYIINMRGELDLTANKNSIVQTKTTYPLLRGRNIGFYSLCDVPSGDYVVEPFVDASAKKGYVNCERIICQQISNMAKERRLTFAYASPNMVLGNSCNFIAVKQNDDDVTLLFLLGVLNSSLLNWYFKLQSSNNHINNYEIDAFPVPIHCEQKAEITSLVKEHLAAPEKKELIEKLDALVREAFLSEKTEPLTEFDERVRRHIEEKEWKLAHGNILNHTSFKLSDLDLEMIRAVPQGGSWKNIPQATVCKSQRLIRINETGGRTTLYGRIDYTKPSYTITTYFNRPGNGTYVHPIHDRVISVREAARFQCFPDNYFFCGNKAQLLNQVGNAVPPLLAYQIGKKIIEATSCKTSLDLFCGAGGLTYGLKLAGIRSVLGNDIDEAACLTLKVNNPEINVLCGDITEESVKASMVSVANEAGVDIICGGPPCQGFSMAGYRLTDDPRNQLFKDFIDIVSRIKPKVIVFENVEGILTFQKGKTYECIHEMFSELGYNTEGQVLATNLFGVPQKRKRVIIICTLKSMSYVPADLYPDAVTPTVQYQISAYDAIGDLEMIECSDDAERPKKAHSVFTKWTSGEISTSEYIATVNSATGTKLKCDEPEQLSIFDIVTAFS